MSNTTLSDYPPAPDGNAGGAPSVPRRARPRPAPVYEEPENEIEEYDEAPSGLFSSPGRAITLIIAMVMLVAVGVGIAWKLGEMSSTSGNTVAATGANPPTGTAPKVGQLAPDFALVDVKTKQTVSLSSLRGKPVFVNFWGTWCPPCRAEMPAIEKIYEQKKNDVVILGVSMGPRDEPAGVKQFVDLNAYHWQFIHDADSSVMNNYQVSGIPSSFFIDKNGVIRSIHVGGADGPTLEAALQKALDQ